MAYKNEFLDVVCAAISHGRQEGVEKLTLTWEQWTMGGKPPLSHAMTVTYRDTPRVDGLVQDMNSP